MTSPAITVFLYVAAACAIILTLIGAFVAYLFVRLGFEARSLVREVREEFALWRQARERMRRRTRFWKIWTRSFFRRLVRGAS